MLVVAILCLFRPLMFSFTVADLVVVIFAVYGYHSTEQDKCPIVLCRRRVLRAVYVLLPVGRG